MNDRTWILVVVGLGVVALVLAWLAVSLLPVGALRLLACLPFVAFWLGWKLGSRDARMFLSGLDKGTDTVISAGGKVADLRAAKVAQARQAATPPPQLPDSTRLEIVNVHPSSGEEVIEL